MIIFSGLDGAGKTTQIELLKKNFDQNRIKNEIIWSRGGYTKGMELIKKILRSTHNNSIPKPGRSEEREEKFNKVYIRKIWLFLSILDLILLYCIYFRIKALLGTTIIADRYLLDTAIDFKLNFSDEKVEEWPLWRFINWCAPKPDKHFIALIPVSESLKRSKQKEEPFPDTEEVLIYRKKSYENYLQHNRNAVQIDGLKGINEIHNFILKELVFENFIVK